MQSSDNMAINPHKNKVSFVFFGTAHYSVIALDDLKKAGLLPHLIITSPDKPKGRKLIMTPPDVKVWADANNIPCLQPSSLKKQDIIDKLSELHTKQRFDVFIVVAYGKIIPQEIISIPLCGTVNIHASLLPKLRGASPIETAILQDQKETGVTIMLIDREMDHGPILAQKKIVYEPWPPKARELGTTIVHAGAELLIGILPDLVQPQSSIRPIEQDHTQATYTKKIEKSDGLLDLTADPYQNYLKIQAYAGWPTCYFFIEKNNKKIRVIITEATYNLDTNTLEIIKVIPEGKKEMLYKDLILTKKTLKS